MSHLRTATTHSIPVSPDEIPGHISRAEGEWLRRMAAGKVVLEIGCFRGRSTAFLGASAALVLSCDHFQGQRVLRPGQRRLDMRCVERDWHENVRQHGIAERVTLLRMDSRECLRALANTGRHTPDLVFVDGGHDAETVEHDTRFADLLAPNGVIAFHDYHFENVPDVRRVVDAWFGREDSRARFRRIPGVGSIGAFGRLHHTHLPTQ